jgi:hypothetical protein
MAEAAPLASLLDRAGNVFSLAGTLGRAWCEEHKALRPRGQVDPTGWQHYAADFQAFYDSLLDMRDAMQQPPDGFAPVAEQLQHAARIAMAIQDATQSPNRRMWAEYLEFFPDLNTVFHDGWEAIKQANKPQRPANLFNFLKAPQASIPADINTTPAMPLPPAGLVEAAARDLPGILANVQRRHDGAIALIAAHLAQRLRDAGHTLAAAQWAIHEAVQAGRLRPERIEMELPGFMGLHGGFYQPFGEKGYIGIPQGKPAPFEAFNVVATEALWAWWRALPASTPSHKTDNKNTKPKQISGPIGSFSAHALAAMFGTSFEGSWGKTSEPSLPTLVAEPASPKPIQLAPEPANVPSIPLTERSETAPSADAAKQSAPESPAGFLGGEALANALGIHATQRETFLRQLNRWRESKKLDDDCWIEASDPKPNSPRYLYRIDSLKLRQRAASYKTPKPD